MKPTISLFTPPPDRVAPRTGAWIETVHLTYFARERLVAPRTGAWIETDNCTVTPKCKRVAPRTGAWIETLDCRMPCRKACSRPPHGGVD